jgi:tRNA A37 methylthiotransferase MiaB
MISDDQPTVFIETYGCQMNVSDSELMLGALTRRGYRAVDVPDGADVILLNTCAIRDHAEQRVLGRLGELRRHMGPRTVMGVTGCMAQRLGPQLLEKAKHVSLVVGPDGYRALPHLVEQARAGKRSISTSFDLEEHYEDFQPKRFDRVKAWIPVQRGCDYRCTYCIVPYTRGEKSFGCGLVNRTRRIPGTAPTARSRSAKSSVSSGQEFTVCPSSTTSVVPCSATSRVSRMTSSRRRLRSLPRVVGTMQ